MSVYIYVYLLKYVRTRQTLPNIWKGYFHVNVLRLDLLEIAKFAY